MVQSRNVRAVTAVQISVDFAGAGALALDHIKDGKPSWMSTDKLMFMTIDVTSKA